MTPLETPNLGSVTIARGPATSLGEVYDAARESQILVDNTNSRSIALERAIDNRLDDIYQATGYRLDNPMRQLAARQAEVAIASGGADVPDPEADFDTAISDFDARMVELARERPDAAEAIRPGEPVRRDAINLARDAEGRLGDLLTRSDYLTGWGAAFAGGFVGAIRDPANIGLMFLGGGPARTVLSGALRAAAINAGGEAALQPFIQDWRREAGLPSGIGQAAFNVAIAGALGGTFDLGIRGAAAGISRLSSRADVEQALDGALDRLPDDHVLKRALADGDDDALREAVEQMGELPAEVRGALHEVDMQAHMREVAEGEPLDPAQISAARRFAENPEENAPPIQEADLLPEQEIAERQLGSPREQTQPEPDLETRAQTQEIVAGHIADAPVAETGDKGDILPTAYGSEAEQQLALLESTTDPANVPEGQVMPVGTVLDDRGRAVPVTQTADEMLAEADRPAQLSQLVGACAT